LRGGAHYARLPACSLFRELFGWRAIPEGFHYVHQHCLIEVAMEARHIQALKWISFEWVWSEHLRVSLYLTFDDLFIARRALFVKYFFTEIENKLVYVNIDSARVICYCVITDAAREFPGCVFA
jgi:hypothetical protein